MNVATFIPTPRRAGSRVPDYSGPPNPVRARRILVADDNELIRQLIFSALVGGGFDVDAAADGEQAWEALLHEHYDLLVTDNDMPRLTGTELIERMRKEGMSVPVIVASGTFSGETTHRDPQLQIAAVLAKPFSRLKLLETVRQALPASCGNTTNDVATARVGGTLLPHEASFPCKALPLPTSQAQAAKPIHHRVLIVDDDAMVRDSLAAVLESEGFLVDEAQNGIEAVARAVKHPPDLVLLDLNMPLWDGWTAFRQLDRVTPLLPVIVITASPNQYEKAVQLGVDAFMEKPLNISILVRAIKRFTSEDEKRHAGRITNRAFVTLLLAAPAPDEEPPAPPFPGDER